MPPLVLLVDDDPTARDLLTARTERRRISPGSCHQRGGGSESWRARYRPDADHAGRDPADDPAGWEVLRGALKADALISATFRL